MEYKIDEKLFKGETTENIKYLQNKVRANRAGYLLGSKLRKTTQIGQTFNYSLVSNI